MKSRSRDDLPTPPAVRQLPDFGWATWSVGIKTRRNRLDRFFNRPGRIGVPLLLQQHHLLGVNEVTRVNSVQVNA